MSERDELMSVPGGSLGGPEYTKQEKEAGMQILIQRAHDATVALEVALEVEGPLREAKIQTAKAMMKRAIEDLEAVQEAR